MKNLLSEIIEQKKVPVNALIRNSGIDRSIFFKIKSGNRVPTEDQFCAILNELELSNAEKLNLIREYEYRRYWTSQDEGKLEDVRRFLRLVDGKSDYLSNNRMNEKDQLPAEVCGFFKNELASASKKIIRMFIPSQMIDKYDWSEVKTLLEQSSVSLSVDVLLVSYLHQQEYDLSRKIRNLELYFSLTKLKEIAVNVYRDRFPLDEMIPDPYPYWIIGEESMIRIRDDMDEFVLVNVPSVTAKHIKSFVHRVTLSYRIVKKYTDIKEIVRELSEKCMEIIDKRGRLYVMSAMPFILLAASEDQILKYSPTEAADLICRYHYLLTAAAHSEYVTRSGYAKMKDSRTVPEWNLGLVYPESELPVIEQNIRNRINSGKLYVLSDASEYVPESCSIALFEDLEINIQSLKNPSLVIQVREKVLVEALQHWFSYRDKIAWIEKEVGLG